MNCNCKKCNALQERCEGLADWLLKKGLINPEDEDTDLLTFIFRKMAHASPILDKRSIDAILSAAFMAGLRKGYEMHQLETMAK